ncbi:peptidoglycan-binding protein [bacterium]|nr:peptidoglycan-binding protein [bacterium]
MKIIISLFAFCCLIANASGQSRYGGRILEKGDVNIADRNMILLLQYDLYFLGYGIYLSGYGGASGEYNDATFRAVKALQRDNGLVQHGAVDSKTTLAIEAALKATELGDQWMQFNPLRYGGMKLKQGDRDRNINQTVRLLQNDLTALGFSTEGDDPGYFSDNTVEAIKTFQEDALIPSSGILDENTANALALRLALRSQAKK